MAAVSTNYGTAGNSALEISASGSRGTKGSKAGSRSGSNTASRSVSQSRVQRKRAGTGSRSMFNPVANNLGLGPSRNQSPGMDPMGWDISPLAQGALGNQRGRYSSTSDSVRVPMRRSMFPLSTLGKKQSFQHLDRVKKHCARAGSGSSFLTTSDLIELVPRPHIRHANDATDRAIECTDKMVIHKEVRYSVQFEDEVDMRSREDLKHIVDVSTYV